MSSNGSDESEWPQELKPGEDALRSMMADAQGSGYRFYETLDGARADPDAVVILQGDWGGQIFVVAPVNKVRCTEEELNDLLVDLDALTWTEIDGASVHYERQPVGSGIPGGMGGAENTGDVWVHERLAEHKPGITDVLAARNRRLHQG